MSLVMMGRKTLNKTSKYQGRETKQAASFDPKRQNGLGLVGVGQNGLPVGTSNSWPDSTETR